ncbi:MAG: tRNA pseudouridine(38-40) synthase TruA [Endomicrobia bacterium]|nr:tRNA pseudouridine(38-40) synthase TruA [Endomicrobiia bacterium]MCL2507333.1 tRNA pseudouridine(38-40) synthase TruA [Endomicrobiia bacterium]
MNYKCIAEYDGSNFNGWGKQPGQRTVQGEIEAALNEIFKTPVNITCAGRTDKGVHAFGQVISFKAPEIDPKKLSIRLNSLLPKDISVRVAKHAEDRFDARKSAIAKTYLYLIYNSPMRSPIYQNRAWHISNPLDITKMKKAAKFLQAKRDYSAFDSYNSIFDYKTVDLRQVKVLKRGKFIAILVKGDRFLYRMVRKIAGELVKIGSDTKNLNDLKDAILSKNRSKIGKPANPCGLYLSKVHYKSF